MENEFNKLTKPKSQIEAQALTLLQLLSGLALILVVGTLVASGYISIAFIVGLF